MTEATYDVFISYRHADANVVQPLATELRRTCGLQVWIDAARIDDFATITGQIATGLAKAKVLVAWYSKRYGESRACQWEFTSALIAAQHEGDPRRRVLLINPEPDNQHINPIELRDELYLGPAAHADGCVYSELAGRIAAHVDKVSGLLGDIPSLTPPQWYPQPRFGSERFVGRLREMWELHSALWASSVPIITNRVGPAFVQLVGLGGNGKSLLVEEYGLRFGAAYPGGIFWLNACGPEPKPRELLTDERERQLRMLAELLQQSVRHCSLPEVEGMLRAYFERQGKPFLWVVDDVPQGMVLPDLQRWTAPHPLGHTVLTTRSRKYSNLCTTVEIQSLDPGAAFDLLTQQRCADSELARFHAGEIAGELGNHALALAVASARIAVCTFEEFLTDLRNPAAEALKLAEQFADELPNGHERSVVDTLLKSIGQLDERAQELLRVAAIMGRAPIPRLAIETALIELNVSRIEPMDRGLAQLAIRNALSHSLVDPTAQDSIHIHELVRKVMISGMNREVSEACQFAVISALNSTWPKWDTVIEYSAFQPWVDHARELAYAHVDKMGEARLKGRIGRFDAERGDRLNALRLLKEALEDIRTVCGNKDPQTLLATVDLAGVELEHGNISNTRSLLHDALAVCTDSIAEDDPAMLAAMDLLGQALSSEGNLTDARAIQEHVVDVRKGTLRLDHPSIANSLDNLANTLARQGDLSTARSLQEQALEVSRRSRGDDNKDTLTIMNNLAITLRDQGDLAGARVLQEQVLVKRRRLLGDHNWTTLNAMQNLAYTLEQQGEVPAARELRDKADALRLFLMNLTYPVCEAVPWLPTPTDDTCNSK
jgi:tetratricopeptide (TPR) repeat protein